MKKILSYHIYSILLSCIAVGILFLPSCKEEQTAAPIITYVRNYAASPNDTILETVNAGQWVVVVGKNLSGVTQALFGTTPATINSTFFSDTCIVIQIPSIPFQSVPRDKVNVITLVNEDGSANFEIKITGAPIVSYMINAADSPNDTIVKTVVPNQLVTIIGFNLKNATNIRFQGVAADLTNAVYTDTSVTVRVPDDFSGSDLILKNKISYETAIGSSTFSVKIKVPIVVGPLTQLLTGGEGPGKTWAYGASTQFQGPLFYGGDDLGWNRECTKEGGNCWYWETTWQSWMGPADPATTDFGTMTFTVSEEGTFVTVNQKVISTKGVYNGSFALDENAKTIIFVGLDPLRMGWNDAKYRNAAHILTLTGSTMQLAFDHTNKAEFQIFNFIAK